MAAGPALHGLNKPPSSASPERFLIAKRRPPLIVPPTVLLQQSPPASFHCGTTPPDKGLTSGFHHTQVTALLPLSAVSAGICPAVRDGETLAKDVALKILSLVVGALGNPQLRRSSIMLSLDQIKITRWYRAAAIRRLHWSSESAHVR